MYKGCKLLPELIKIPYPIESEEAENMLYDLYKKNLYDADWYYKNKSVVMRDLPKHNNKEESFFHIISDKNILGSGSYYTINIERAKRMLWGKAIIENEPCPHQCCQGIYVWNFNYKNRIRTKIFHPKFNYLIILEERQNYWLYITSYRINNSYRRKDLIAEYKKNKKRQTNK